MLQNLYPDDFHVDIDYEPKINDVNYWKQYQIVHAHRSIGQNYDIVPQLIKQLKLDEIEGAITKKYTFDFPYPAGIYFINLHTNTGRQSVKVVK